MKISEPQILTYERLRSFHGERFKILNDFSVSVVMELTPDYLRRLLRGQIEKQSPHQQSPFFFLALIPLTM